MKDLISRKQAIQRMIEETEASKKNVIHINEIKRLLQDIDAIETVEVVHAEKAPSCISRTGLMCTNCYSNADRDAVYCKYCGAKFDNN